MHQNSRLVEIVVVWVIGTVGYLAAGIVMSVLTVGFNETLGRASAAPRSGRSTKTLGRDLPPAENLPRCRPNIRRQSSHRRRLRVLDASFRSTCLVPASGCWGLLMTSFRSTCPVAAMIPGSPSPKGEGAKPT